MKKNCWLTFDTVTGVVTGSGTGPKPSDTLGPNEVVRYRDTMAQVCAEAAFVYADAANKAFADLSGIDSRYRSQAFTRKAEAAHAYLALSLTTAERELFGVDGLATIDSVAQRALYIEYRDTHHLLNSMTPTQLSNAIIGRADDAIDAEVARRIKILSAEAVLGASPPAVPDE